MFHKALLLFKSNRKFFNQVFLISISSILASFFAYYFNFLVQSKFPDLELFSNFQLFVTILSLIAILPSTFSTSISTMVGELNNEETKDQLTDFFIKVSFIFLIFGIFLFLIINLLQPFLSSFFKISYPYFFSYLSVIVLISVVSTPITSFLFGLMKLYSYSFLLVLAGILKISFLFYFFSQLYGFNSIFYSFIVSILICQITGLLFLRNSFTLKIKYRVPNTLIKKIFLLSGAVLFILVGKDLISQFDFMLVKSKFDSLTSGNYALLLNLGKIFLFGSLIILGAMLPQIAESFQKKENFFQKFRIYMVLEGFVVGVGLVFFIFFPKTLIDLLILVSRLIGLNPNSFSSYYNITHYLPWYGVFIALVVVINFLSIFLVAIQHVRIFIPFILALVVQSLLIFFIAWDIYSVIICNIMMAVVLVVYLIYEVRKKYQDFNHSSSL